MIVMKKQLLQNNASFRYEAYNMLFLFGCIPYYTTQSTLESLKNLSRLSLFFSFLKNFLWHCYEFTFSLSFLVVQVSLSVILATIFNFIFILGGFISPSIYYKTGAYNQFAIKSVFFLIMNTSAFLMEQVTLLIGLIFPYYILDKLEQITEAQPKNNDLFESQYLYYVYSIGAFLQRHNFNKLSMIVASLLAEPVDSIIQGIRMIRGGNKEYHVYGANPKSLTEEQKKLRPVLCLHGYSHNQSAFEQLLFDLKNRLPNQPVFTLKLIDIEVNDVIDAKEELRQKEISSEIVSIKKLYENDSIEPIIIGHSSGADSAANYKNRLLVDNSNSSTSTMCLLLGANIYSKDKNDKHISAQYDEILTLPSEEKLVNKPDNFFEKSFATAHLGLLTHPAVIDYCINEVSNIPIL